jgi:hypothetical protein
MIRIPHPNPSFVKVIAELRRASDLSAYARHPKIIPKFGMDYAVSMGFGLHSGWAIEGAIGSEHKIDASYAITLPKYNSEMIQKLRET